MHYPFEQILTILRKKEAKKRFKTRFFRLLHINCIYLVIITIIESIWYMPSAVRWILLIPLTGNVLLLFWLKDYFHEKNIRKNPLENIRLMEALGNRFPEVKDRFINAWQLSKNSDPLSRLAVQRLAELLPPHYLFKELEKKESPTLHRSLMIKTALCVGIFILTSLFLWDGFVRLLTPSHEYPIPFPWTWEVHPGNVTQQENDSLEIQIIHSLPPHFPKRVTIKESHKTKIYVPETINDTTLRVFLPDLQTSFTYFFSVHRPHIFMPWKEKSSPVYEVQILKRPILEFLEFYVIPPAYTRLEEEIYTGGTDKLLILEGSQVNIKGELSVPVGSGKVQFNDQQIYLKTNDRRFEVSLTPMRSGTLILTATDTLGMSLENEMHYKISLYPDKKPILAVLEPETDLLLNETMTIPWQVFISDDFGIVSFALETQPIRTFQQHPDTTWKENPLPFHPEEYTQTLTGVWTVKERLSPGDVLNFRFKVVDNNTYTGPGISYSQVFKARFPSLTELFARSEQQHFETQDNLQALQRFSEDLEKRAEALKKDILKKGETDWLQQEAIKNLVEQQDTIKETIKSLQESIQKQLEELEEQNLFSEEVLDNMSYLQDLIRELENSELFIQLQKMQEKLQQEMDPNSLLTMSEELQKEAKKFSESLERTIRLLEELRDLERLEEGERLLTEALQKQKTLLKEESERTSYELANTEKEVSQILKDLQKKLNELPEGMNERLSQKFEKFSDILDAAKLQEMLQSAASAFSENERTEGLQHAEQAGKILEEMVSQYQEMMASIQQGRKEEILQDFQRMLHRALVISEKQEKILPGTQKVTKDSQALQERLSEQNFIQESLKQLTIELEAISRKTFFMGPRPFQEVEKAQVLSQEILDHFQEGRFYQAEQAMTQNLSQINQLTGTLLALMGQAQSSESGTGMEQLMDQLQALAEMQGALNRDSQGMPMPLPGPGNETMMLMSELAARQQALRRELEKIQQVMEQMGDGTSQHLENISSDMEEVIRDLRQKRYTRRTIQRQQGIEQRLLDASRSIHTRELSRERESQTGKQSVRSSPEQLPHNLGSKESLIQSIREKLNNTSLSPEERTEMERYLENLRDMVE